MLDPFREFVNSKRTGADSTIAIENCHCPECGNYDTATVSELGAPAGHWFVFCYTGKCSRRIEFIGSKRTAVIAFYDRLVPNYSKPTEVFPCSTSPTP